MRRTRICRARIVNQHRASKGKEQNHRQLQPKYRPSSRSSTSVTRFIGYELAAAIRSLYDARKVRDRLASSMTLFRAEVVDVSQLPTTIVGTRDHRVNPHGEIRHEIINRPVGTISSQGTRTQSGRYKGCRMREQLFLLAGLPRAVTCLHMRRNNLYGDPVSATVLPFVWMPYSGLENRQSPQNYNAPYLAVNGNT